VTLGSHQQTVGKSQNHITPKRLIDQLGPFDLDPCAAEPRPWDCARINWSVEGLARHWFGLVYLNPPFDRYDVANRITKPAQHGNGICLLHARTEAEWFEPIWQRAAAILSMADRIKFCRPDGTEQPAHSGAQPGLCAFSDEAVLRLRRSGIAGPLVTRWHNQPASPAHPLLSVVGD
jgi:DNA N-6-adenine-methyltransferase (Dam)